MIRLRSAFFITLGFVLPICSSAQSNPEWNGARIKLQLEKLNVLGSVLYLAAHPDDENSRLIPWLAYGKLYRTAYLSLTRGDGGQNLLGDEQGAWLGLVRTEELLAARKVDGAEQFFSRANDFGFSKTADETLRFWGRDRILGDMVWVIREFRPDVIICRFPADRRAGHGNHWASSLLAHDAFAAAADPKMFPEQLKYLKPWKTTRLLWNTFSFGGTNTTSPDQFHIDDGVFNPFIGESYGEIAAESRTMHKTQGAALTRQRGSSNEYFTTILGDPPTDSLLQGVNTGWSRVAGGEGVGVLVTKAIAAFNLDHPSASLPALLEIYATIHRLPDSYWRTEKLKETVDLVEACSGLWLSAISDQQYVAQGDPVRITFTAVNRSDFPLTLEKISYENKDTTTRLDLRYDNSVTLSGEAEIGPDHPISQPYWLIQPHPDGYYEVPDPLMTGRPENPPAISVNFQIRAGDQLLDISRPVQYRYNDPVNGELEEPLAIVPPVTANLSSQVFIFDGSGPRKVQVELESFKDGMSGNVILKLPEGFSVEPVEQNFQLPRKGDKTTLDFRVEQTRKPAGSKTGTLTAEIHIQGRTYDRGIHIIAYSHIPTLTVFPTAEASMVSLDLKMGGRNIGYIPGAGDLIPDALRQTGYQVTILSPGDASQGGLSRFDAIITGVRAYNVTPQLRYLQDSLLAYVYQGGTLLIQYNKPFPLVTRQLGPFPFTLTGERVTDETAPVTFLLPEDPALNYPNKITQGDFDGWIQERGLYFTGNADSHYRKLFSMHDPDENALDGSTIVASYGKGTYVYTSLDFFRELPAGVPGAFRLFANLLAGRSAP
jgi:LmbE family N-acetylglucosaminyl deacetylase